MKKRFKNNVCLFFSFLDGPYSGWTFLGCLRTGGAKRPPLPKTCHTHPTMMKLGTLLSYQKLCKSRGTPLWVLLTSAFFHRKSVTCYIKKTDIDCILIHNLYIFFYFFESLKVVLITMALILCHQNWLI